MKRKIKASSVDGAVNAMQNVLAAPLPSPWPLSKAQQPIWDEIVLRRSRDEWQPIDLRFAWELADVMVRLKEEKDLLKGEGTVLAGERGATANPRNRVVQQLSRQAMSLAVYLRIHPASDYAEPQLARAGRKAEQEARTAMRPPDKSDPRRDILPMM
jgi:hypothetical protein